MPVSTPCSPEAYYIGSPRAVSDSAGSGKTSSKRAKRGAKKLGNRTPEKEPQPRLEASSPAATPAPTPASPSAPATPAPTPAPTPASTPAPIPVAARGNLEQEIRTLFDFIWANQNKHADSDDSDEELPQPECVKAAYAQIRALMATDVRGPEIVEAAIKEFAKRSITSGSLP